MTDNQYDTNYDSEPEISFGDIIEYLKDSWRWLLAGAVVGPILALTISSFLGKYQAEIILDNLPSSGSSGLSFTDWRNLSENFPPMASQLHETQLRAGKIADKESWLASPEWWSKNVTPTYGLNKKDAKELAAVGDELKGESTKIVNLKVAYSSRNSELALQRAGQTVEFLRRASLYMTLKVLLTLYKTETVLTAQSIAKGLLDKEIELRYLKERVNGIESLINSQQADKPEGKIIVDVRNGEAKYLPLETQLNAVKLDIDALEESRQRLLDLHASNELISRFVVLAQPLLEAENEANGIALMEKLMAAESQLRSDIPETERVKRSAIERVRTDLVGIQSRFSNQMPELSRTVRKPSYAVPALAGGLMGGFLLALLGTLFARKYRQYRQSLQDQPTVA